MYMIANSTPSTMPSAIAQIVMMIVFSRPIRIALAVKNCPTTFHSICPAANAWISNAKASRISAAAIQRP